MRPRMARQVFLRGGIALLLFGIVAAMSGPSSAWAQSPTSVPGQIAALEKRLGQLTAVVNSQSQLISLLQLQNQDLQAKLGCMSKTGDEVFFTGCNVHIVSGSGATEEAVNGLGNLIIGYNEDAPAVLSFAPPSIRGGSHNLVIGPGHSYPSYGGLVAGRVNSVTGPNATVSGGVSNTASGHWSSVSGGEQNNASGTYSTVSGASAMSQAETAPA
jgi:hypothetical protein